MPSKSRLHSDCPVAVDVFAGVGGLTLGLKNAGFRVGAAVELDPHSFSSYKANHPEVQAFKQDIRSVSGLALKGAAGGVVHLLVGCPPCQGFSSLTSKWKKGDPRNDLVREMTRLVDEICPMAVMMENVPGLVRRGKPLFDEFVRRLEANGYLVAYDILQLADYGVPQHRRRLVLLAGRGFQIDLPRPTHSRQGKEGLTSWRTVRDAIWGRPRPVTLREAKLQGGPGACNWHVVRDMSDINRQRLRSARAGRQRYELPVELRPECHKGKDEGFTNVYGRMNWTLTSPTITGGCTTLSKGRFGHPQRQTTISVREAATIQQFPEDYIFDCALIDRVCEMIGNALPSGFAEIAASQCRAAINRHLKSPRGPGMSAPSSIRSQPQSASSNGRRRHHIP